MKTPPAVLLWVALALMAYAGTAWAWDRLQLPNPLRIVDLIASGDVTAGDDLISTDDTTVGDDLVVTDDGTFATVTFSGGGTPCLTRGGNTSVQTCTGDGFVDLGTFQVQGTSSDFWDSIRNTVTGASCSSNTGAVCINDPQGLAVTDGSGTTVAVITAAGAVSGDTGISSGTWSAMWWTGAAIPEGSDGMGGYRPTTIGRGSKFRQVACSCRVAGTGGTTGIVLSLMEDGVEVDTQEINAAADTNACDDAAGALLTGDFNYTIVADRLYELQVKSTTDCAGNPTDCLCGTDVTR